MPFAGFNKDRNANFADVSIFRFFFLDLGNGLADLNGDGLVNFADLARMKSLFARPPGSSAQAPLDAF